MPLALIVCLMRALHVRVDVLSKGFLENFTDYLAFLQWLHGFGVVNKARKLFPPVPHKVDRVQQLHLPVAFVTWVNSLPAIANKSSHEFFNFSLAFVAVEWRVAKVICSKISQADEKTLLPLVRFSCSAVICGAKVVLV